MTRHLVSKLDRAGQLALRDEIIARLNVAHAALTTYAEKHKDVPIKEFAGVVGATYEASLAGLGFAVEEIRNDQAMRRAQDKRGVP